MNKKTYTLSIFLMALLSFLGRNSISAQSLSEQQLEDKLTLILDSIQTYVQNNDIQKVQSVSCNGIAFLQKKGLYDTKVASILWYYAGLASLGQENYVGAKMDFKNAFVLDEYWKFGIDIYSLIKDVCKGESHMYSFVEVLDIAKSDSIVLKLLANDSEQLAANINSVAQKYYQEGNYASSIEYFEMEMSLIESIGETGNPTYLSIYPLLIENLNGLKDYSNASKIADEYIDMAKYYAGENSLEYVNALQRKANVEYTFGKSVESVKLYTEALSLIEKIQGKENKTYVACLHDLALVYTQKNDNVIKQIELNEEAASLIEKAKDATWEDKANCFFMLSSTYGQLGNRIKQLDYARKTVQTYEKSGIEISCNYAQYLSNLSTALTNSNQFEEAIFVGQKSIDIYKKAKQTQLDNIGYRLAVGDLAQTYYQKGDLPSAVLLIKTVLTSDIPDDEYKLGQLKNLFIFSISDEKERKQVSEKLLTLSEKIVGKESPEYAEALMYASVIQEKTGDKIMMLQQASEIFKKCYGEKSESYLKTRQALAFLQYNTQSSESTVKSITSNMASFKSLYGDQSRDYFMAYLNQNSFSQCSGMTILEKISEIKTFLSQIKDKFGEQDELYLRCKYQLADANESAYEIIGDTNYIRIAVEIQRDVVKRSKEIYGENNIDYISAIEDLAQILSQYKNYDFSFRNPEACLYKYADEVDRLQKEACELHKKVYGEQSTYYAHSVWALGRYYYRWLSNTALILDGKMMGYKDIITGEDSRDNPIYKNKLYPRIQENISLYNTALVIYKSKSNEEKVASILSDLYRVYDMIDEKEQAAAYMRQSFDLWKGSKLSEFSMLTNEEKSNVVNSGDYKLYKDIYTMNAFAPGKTNSTYTSLAYDMQLLDKGMLLSSEIGLRELILESGDAESMAKLNRLIQIKSEISKEDINETDEKKLLAEYETTERALMKQSQQYGDYMKNMSISTNDVRASLKDNDIAIEFAVYHTLDHTKKRFDAYLNEYYALTLKKGYSAPKVIRLCMEDKLKNIDSLYYNVWQPLEKELAGVGNVYFAPILALNNLPLESVKLPNGKIISEEGRRYYRLSSTRELAINHEKNPYNSAVLYGGLRYDASVDDMISSDKEERANGLRGVISSKGDEITDLRKALVGFRYLDGTKTEVSQIGNLVSKNIVNTKVYTDNKGTESTFKNLSGKKTNIIHIATHGFYVKTNKSQSEEEILKRSGLALAGANNIRSGEKLPEGVDDGILTASEISRMDLRNLDLVVLSACETGLGDVNSDGVYGLQRGFKKAGASSLVMSLWSVPDIPTQLLMVEFYKNLMHGKSKYDSLENAKKYLRTYNNGIYASPENWSAFILLDGLD